MHRLPAEALSFRLRLLRGAKDAQETQAQGVLSVWPKAELGISALMRQPVGSVCLAASRGRIFRLNHPHSTNGHQTSPLWPL